MIFAIILGYFIGALPFSFIVPKLVKGIDVRTIGSGNVGATNVYRCCGRTWAFIAFLGDFAKGLVVILIAHQLWGYNASLVAGLSTLIGHCYTVFLNFKGGKGVSTFVGIILILNPLMFAILGVIEIGIILKMRMVSLASIIAATALPVVAIALNTSDIFIVFCLLSGLFVIFQHRSNIGRLLRGVEKKMGKKTHDNNKKI